MKGHINTNANEWTNLSERETLENVESAEEKITDQAETQNCPGGKQKQRKKFATLVISPIESNNNNCDDLLVHLGGASKMLNPTE